MNYFVGESAYSGEAFKIIRFYIEKTFDGVISSNNAEMCSIELYGETSEIYEVRRRSTT